MLGSWSREPSFLEGARASKENFWELGPIPFEREPESELLRIPKNGSKLSNIKLSIVFKIKYLSFSFSLSILFFLSLLFSLFFLFSLSSLSPPLLSLSLSLSLFLYNLENNNTTVCKNIIGAPKIWNNYGAL